MVVFPSQVKVAVNLLLMSRAFKRPPAQIRLVYCADFSAFRPLFRRMPFHPAAMLAYPPVTLMALPPWLIYVPPDIGPEAVDAVDAIRPL